jgi:DNA-binding GntR family transcriptional regulator
MKRSPQLDLPPIRIRRNGDQLWLQLRRVLRNAIASGALAPGSRLPSSRVMARRLRVSRNTVLAAYESLSAEGLLSGHIGSGTRVCARSAALVRLLAASEPDSVQRLRESDFPLEAVAFDDPDGHAVYMHD